MHQGLGHKLSCGLLTSASMPSAQAGSCRSVAPWLVVTAGRHLPFWQSGEARWGAVEK